jgi:hypothetical protein
MPDDKMGFLGYCCSVVQITVHGAISRASFVIFVMSVITGAALWLAPKFGMTIDSSGLETMLHSPKFYTVVVISVIIFNLIFAQYRIWAKEQDARIAAEKKLRTYELDIAQLEIVKVICEHVAVGKIFLDFRIKNYSKPTTLKNWELSVVGPNLIVHGLNPARPIFNNKTQNRDGGFIGENLTEDPLPPFAERCGQFIYACHGQQAEQFSQPGLSFDLSVEDVFGRKITASHIT